MYCFYADDGRVLTPPNELEPQLRDAFPAISKLLGHIRWFYMADEIWDGKSSLVFSADSEQFAAITLDDNVFFSNVRAAKQSGVPKVVLEKIGADANIPLALWEKNTPTARNAESIILVKLFVTVIIRLNAI